ncbi:hypothetical protein TIFTF001_009563 [Ficus carica]|uniref:Uncharacterized protein n=1 Tax=Ficus carica TaxID=3494 RepID=A0AA88D2P7_FICCA|nr:hypothetical protein TIFTF001_009563 [Ficus carica]
MARSSTASNIDIISSATPQKFICVEREGEAPQIDASVGHRRDLIARLSRYVGYVDTD